MHRSHTKWLVTNKKWLVGLGLIFCLLAATSTAFSNQAMSGSDTDAEASASSETQAPMADPEAEVGLMRSFEEQVNNVSGWCVEKLAAVMFYEIIGAKQFSVTLDSVVSDVESIRGLVKKADAAGLNPDESNYTLTLPKGAISKAQFKQLQDRVKKEFTTGRTRSFSVTESDADDSEKTTQFVARVPGFPLVVLWLVLGAVFFTLRMRFINVRAFKHAILVTAGRYDDPDHQGEVSHFQALSAALSATVGLGNIAGVAIAVMTGGPGATFWMIIAGFLGMTAKFTECTLGQMYREVRADGRIMGGAMYYLSNGLKDLKLAALGKALAILFAVLCVLASLGGGNAFQVNQSLRAVEQTIPALQGNHWVYGVIMTVAVGVVIIGGIRRIAATAEKIVPLMCCIYVLACLWVLFKNFGEIPAALTLIVTEAFTPRAGYGGMLGVLILGFRRAAFSNEAGVGSAAIAHSAAKTDHPTREGIVALLEPFIDTVVVCTMTALVIVITGAYENPEYAQFVADDNGAGLTSKALGEEISWFPYVLAVAVILFAYSTMISWSYYGERCFVYLFGDRSSMTYRIIFLAFVLLGSIMSATNVLNLSDLMILGMAFPNILGVVLLSGKVKRGLDDYWHRYKAGEFQPKP